MQGHIKTIQSITISKVRFNHKYTPVEIQSQIDVSGTVSGKWSSSSHWLWQTAHQGFTGCGVINLDIFTKAVIFAESFTLHIFTTSLKCVYTYIYLIRWNTSQNNVFTKAVIFSEILDSPLNLSPCIRLWVGGGE